MYENVSVSGKASTGYTCTNKNSFAVKVADLARSRVYTLQPNEEYYAGGSNFIKLAVMKIE